MTKLPPERECCFVPLDTEQPSKVNLFASIKQVFYKDCPEKFRITLRKVNDHEQQNDMVARGSRRRVPDSPHGFHYPRVRR